MVSSNEAEGNIEHLRLMLKTKQQYLSKNPSVPSGAVLIKHGMEFCLAGDYIFKCEFDQIEHNSSDSEESSE